jgi:acyl-[acyl-carrier-protein]-phospholipid O-acyltransferase/long-chain-fatty-acid--[acyl-carrier-protein] ligase
MKVYEAPGLIAEEAGAQVVPVQINGLQYSYFSKVLSVDKRPFPKVTISFIEAQKFSKSRKARAQREFWGHELYNIMMQSSYRTMFDKNQSIFSLLMKSAKLYGHAGLSRKEMVEDIDRNPQTYKDIVVKSFVLGRKLAEFTKKNEHLGLMLPNSIANLCTFFGTTAYDRVPAMINFTAGIQNIIKCCTAAVVKKVITSRKFVSVVGLENIIEALENAKIEVYYLEDFKNELTLWDKLKALFLYKIKYIPSKIGGKRPGVILFTSGSEGDPKAVCLSHYNIISNVAQICSMINISPQDKWFNALPMFHSFGLTTCTLLPLFAGARLFLYPSPLHHRVIPELCYNTNATLICGTNTFLKNYALAAHPYDFHTIRLAACGAEALQEDTRNLWIEKFGIRIIVGYGTTETAPVLTFNSPMYNRTGSIGKILPGVEYKIKKVEGVEKGGELVVRGDNIMMGYMKLDNPGKIIPPKDGWYETGDIVEVDEDGYMFIKDRIKRFAKVAGEMVSLSSVEILAKNTYAEDEITEFAAVGIPHETKGEQIVLIATNPDIKLGKIAEYAKLHGVSEISLPKQFLYLEQLPLFASGKRDYVTLKKVVLAHFNKNKFF